MCLSRKILLLLLCLSLLIPKIGEAGTKAAVIVGISDYPEASNIPDLQSAAQDAQNFSDYLNRHDYQAYTLIDAEATRENFKQYIDVFARDTTQAPFEIVIFYFSGRGARVPDEQRLSDEEDGYDECLLLSDAEAEQVETYLRDDELLRLLAQIQAGLALLILDCSFNSDPADVLVKGFGVSTGGNLDGVNPMKEGDRPSLRNAVVLSASQPGKTAADGILTPALLAALDTEEADTTSDRRLSMREIHQYLKSTLGERQTPQLFDPWQLNPILAVLPPLPTLQITSNPSGADVFITRVNQADDSLIPSDQKEWRYSEQTPLQLELKLGTYRIELQKSGFRRPPTRDIELTAYNEVYTLEPVTLQPIEIHGTVVNANGNPVPLGLNLMAEIRQNGKIINQKQIRGDGAFHLSSEQADWLQLDRKYSVTISGKQILKSDPVPFTFTGHEDLSISVDVVLDTTPPELLSVDLSSSRTAPDKDSLLPGDRVLITIRVRDSGLGVESATLSLRRSAVDELLTLKPNASQDGDSVYRFPYSIPETPAAAEGWTVAQIELKDKGGNSRQYRVDEINIHFTVFPNPLVIGESYFKKGAYAKSLAAFGLTEMQTDRSRYLTALAHYELNSIRKATETFLTITDAHTYLGHRPPDLPSAPRPLVDTLWEHYQDGLSQNRQNPEYLRLLEITAEALSCPEETALYRKYREQLLDKEEPLIREKITIGGFVGQISKVTVLNGDWGRLSGGRGGLIINRTFAIGGGGCGGTIRGLDFGYGGLELEYIRTSREVTHFSLQALIGGGNVEDRARQSDSIFFVAEAGVNLILKVTTFFRLGVGASYRFTNGVNLENLSDLDASGPSATLTFKLGKF